MPKKRKIFGQAGSFISPFLRYFVEMNMIVNPVDAHGAKICKTYYQMCLQAKPQFLQPTFIYTMKVSGDCRSSRLHIKYLNGWEKTYFLEKSTFQNVQLSISNYNYYLEGIRALQGQDDELDDELRII